MSLPSQAVFYYRGRRVGNYFVNCGWFYSDDVVPRLLQEIKYPNEWDELEMYECRYTKENVEEILNAVRR